VELQEERNPHSQQFRTSYTMELLQWLDWGILIWRYGDQVMLKGRECLSFTLLSSRRLKSFN
jgi:hypothetical protein